MAEEEADVILGAAEDVPRLGGEDSYRYYERRHRDTVDGCFQALTERSGIDTEKNRETVARYREETEKRDLVAKMLRGKKALRVFLVVLIAVGAVLFGLGIYFIAAAASGDISVALAVVFPAAGAAAVVSGAVILPVRTKPKIREFSDELSHRNETVRKLESEAWEEMRPLNELFTDDTEIELLRRTFREVIRFEPYFSVSTLAKLAKECEFHFSRGDASCMTDTLSGTCLGNPFVFTEVLTRRVGVREYYGHMTIHWEEHHKDSDGNDVTDYESQTLHASVTKPFPEYETETSLRCGCKDLKDLAFIRGPAVTIKKKPGRDKKRNKSASAAAGNAALAATPPFEEIFHAREVSDWDEFDKLFTDEAEENMTWVLTSKEGFGDDFVFVKEGRCVTVRAQHMRGWKLHTEARVYMSMDYDSAASNFAARNADYFKRFYFSFAPIFALPAYTEGYPEYGEGAKDAPGNFTVFEHEVMAEKLLEGEGRKFMAPVPLDTRCVVKTRLLEKREDGDLVRVTASGDYGEKRTDYVAVRGGDGYLHNVPVDWTEYFPVTRETDILVSEEGATSAGTAAVTYHGLRAAVIV